MTSPGSHLMRAWAVVLVVALGGAGSLAQTSGRDSRTGNTVPPAWVPRIAASQMFYAPTDVGVAYMPLIGNGYVGTTVGGTDTYLAGIFNGDANITPSHRARLPSNLAGMSVPACPVTTRHLTSVGHITVTVSNADVTACALDIERAIYYRRSALEDATIEQRWYAHRANRSLLVMELEVWLAKGSAGVTLKLATNSGPASTDLDLATYFSNQTMTTVNGSTLLPEDDISPLHIVSVAASVVPPTLDVKANQTFTYLAAFRTSLDTPRTGTVGAVWDDFAWAKENVLDLQDLHVEAWAQLWATGGYEIDGRPDVARSVNASLYSILTAVRADFHFSLSPGGLTDGYNGHTFWDCETWMYPNMAVLHPGIASGLLQYRFDRIAGAQHFAKSFNPPYTGNMFVWESAFTGRNVCPKGVGTCTREIHISGDIAVAIRQYWRLTNDKTFLRNTAYPIVSGIADFWVSRATVDSASGTASINNVIGPDEYHDHVNNSVYTNSVARISLEFATEVAGILGESPKPEWMTLAGQLVILFNGTIHPEYEGYDGSTIKQADVILLGFPLDIQFGNMSRAVRLADLDYYGKRTSITGPAMTWGMQAIGYIDAGELDLAYSNFNRSFANVQEPFLVWAETPLGGTTNFITGAGGYIQTVLFGWPQLRINKDAIPLNPLLPQGATRAKIRGFHYMGWSLDIEYDATSVTVSVRQPGPGSPLMLTATTTGKAHPVTPASPVTLPVQPLSLAA